MNTAVSVSLNSQEQEALARVQLDESWKAALRSEEHTSELQSQR